MWGIYRMSGFSSNLATSSKSKTPNTSSQLARMEQQIDSLALVCQAMWEIIRDNTDITEETLEEKVHEVDLRDGKLDGKMNRIERDCPACGRSLHRRHSHCLYCGCEIEIEHIFQK